MNLTQKRLYLIDKYLQANGKELFGNDFEFKVDSSCEETFEKVVSEDKFRVGTRDITIGNAYFNNEKVITMLNNLGYTEVETGTYIDGLPIKFYLPEKNTAILTTNFNGYLFDNKTLRTQLELTKKCAETSPKKMKVHVLNVNELFRKDDEACTDYLESIGIERLAEK